jgi:hypothetical protein
MPILTEAPKPGEAIISRASGTRSQDAITVMASQTLLANHVIGRTATAATVGAAVAGAGNTGNGTVTLNATPWQATVQAGVYRAVFIEPAANLGTFVVEGPDGIIVGRGVVGTEFANQIVFTIADGSTDFVSGDLFTFTVTAVSHQWGTFDPAATDGRAVPRGILFYPVTTGVGVTAPAVAFVRAIEVNSQKLQWLSSLNAGQRTAGIALLNANSNGITVRT